jgi:hypothetical protein
MEYKMNEQIRKLMIEAGKTIPGDKQIDADFCEKFAELLIKECAELFDKNETDVRIPEYQIHDSIMIHFGLY